MAAFEALMRHNACKQGNTLVVWCAGLANNGNNCFEILCVVFLLSDISWSINHQGNRYRVNIPRDTTYIRWSPGYQYCLQIRDSLRWCMNGKSRLKSRMSN